MIDREGEGITVELIGLDWNLVSRLSNGSAINVDRQDKTPAGLEPVKQT